MRKQSYYLQTILSCFFLLEKWYVFTIFFNHDHAAAVKILNKK